MQSFCSGDNGITMVAAWLSKVPRLEAKGRLLLLKIVKNNCVRRSTMFFMSFAILILAVLSFLSVADIRPSGGLFDYIYENYHYLFLIIVAINLISFPVLGSAKFLIFVLVGLFLWIRVSANDSVFLSDKVWTVIYINFDISPCDNDQCKSLKRLSSSKDVEKTCGESKEVNAPFNELCVFLSRGWSRFFMDCNTTVIYFRRETNDYQRLHN